MIAKVITAAPIGFDGAIIEVEADMKAGLPSIQIVGMGNKSIDEARERVRSAIRNSLLDFPARKLTINLAPAELPKDGTSFDLAIAVAILVVSGQLRQREVDGALFAGELALDGQLRGVRGALHLAEATGRHGATHLYLPLRNVEQASLVDNIEIIGVRSLQELYLHLKGIAPLTPYQRTALIGGGGKPRPGEVSLAHRGVLFLDELLEFPRATLEALRQPLEDKEVSLARASGHLTFPADFVLVAATNPCPCGYFGDSTHECTCGLSSIIRYQKKLSGPLLDRIDMRLSVSQASPFEQETMRKVQQSKVLSLIENTVLQQQKRYKSSITYNGNVDDGLRKKTERCSPAAAQLLTQAAWSLGLSMRARGKVLRVARTIADLANSATIEPQHIAEALQFRGSSPTGL